MDIATRIKQCRGKLSQDELSELLGVHKNSIGRYERGDSTPDMVFAQGICIKLGVCPEWLMFGTGSMRLGDTALTAKDSACNATPETPIAAQESACGACAELKKELELERRERRELATENRELTTEVRLLWKESSALREKYARFEERQFQHSLGRGDGEAVDSAG